MNTRWLLRAVSIVLLIASVVGFVKAREHASSSAEQLEASVAALAEARSRLNAATELGRANRQPSVGIGDGAAELLAYLRVQAPAAGIQFNFLAVGTQTAGSGSPAAVSSLASRVPEGERAAAFYLTGVGTYRDLPELVRWCDGLAARSVAVVKLDISGNEIRQMTLAVYGLL